MIPRALVAARLSGLLCGCLLCACGGESDPLAAIASARSGETVLLPDGTYDGPVTVPAGVTVSAERPGGATIQLQGTGAVLVVETAPGGPPTVLSGIHLDSAADAALLARGGGTFRGEALTVRCSRGVGVAAEGLADLTLAQSTLAGTITAADIPTLAFPVDAQRAPVVGLILSRVDQGTLEDLSLSGFGGFGAVLVASDATWDGGTLQDNVGVGIMQDGGALTLRDLRVQRTVPGQLGTAILAYAAVVAGQGALTTSRLEIVDNEGYGVLQDDALASHQDLRVQGNRDVGLWVQRSPGTNQTAALRLTGAQSQIVDNRGGGLFAIGSGAIVVEDASLSQTTGKSVPVGETGVVTMGDGIQLSQMAGSVELVRVKLSDNARVGLLLSGPVPEGKSVTLTGVTIDGTGQNGLIVQDGLTADPAWQLTRSSALEQADATFTGRLEVARPQGVVPSVAVVRQGGLIGDGALFSNTGAAQRGIRVSQVGLTPEDD